VSRGEVVSETQGHGRARTIMSERKYFGKIREVIDPPNLIEIQLNSYVEFLQTNVTPGKARGHGSSDRFQGGLSQSRATTKKSRWILPATISVSQN
jgi:DNA-directed RNA polymerase beta subunit